MPVVLLAHGSRHRYGVASIDRLCAAVNAAGVDARTAYLDLNQPDLDATAAALRAEGQRRAVVVPLLFTPAFHARTDAPATIARAAERSGLELITADILGTPDDLLTLLTDAGSAAGIPDDGDALLTAVGSSRAEANAAVAELAGRLGAVRGGTVRTAFATCEPRAEAVLAAHPETVGVYALFVGHGLLLDGIAAAAAARGIPVAAPLEDALAPLVIERYRAALS